MFHVTQDATEVAGTKPTKTTVQQNGVTTPRRAARF
jgi:hypothetical protein